MKKPIVGLVIIALLVVTVAYNLPAKTSNTLDKSRSEANSKVLDAQALAELEGGRIRLRCIAMLTGAVALALSGPGIVLAMAASMALVCSCDKEIDRIFKTRFGVIC